MHVVNSNIRASKISIFVVRAAQVVRKNVKKCSIWTICNTNWFICWRKAAQTLSVMQGRECFSFKKWSTTCSYALCNHIERREPLLLRVVKLQHSDSWSSGWFSAASVLFCALFWSDSTRGRTGLHPDRKLMCLLMWVAHILFTFVHWGAFSSGVQRKEKNAKQQQSNQF